MLPSISNGLVLLCWGIQPEQYNHVGGASSIVEGSHRRWRRPKVLVPSIDTVGYAGTYLNAWGDHVRPKCFAGNCKIPGSDRRAKNPLPFWRGERQKKKPTP